MVSVAPGAPKNACPRRKSAISGVLKIVGFRPKTTFRFTGPFHRAIVGGMRFSLRSIGTFDVKEFGLHHFWCKFSP